ncbi:MAG: nicotinate (nicotinamide) nucleotide adenylyltransferase [Chloroflexi bacterium]|nr:nicotinate (nicotinamide) nucleotide adenylyltransferase [Chloroflexota bacterium]
MTIGIFGGTFDPPHLGHLAAAQEALETCGLAQVLFIPSERNPLKLGAPSSDVTHRLEMTALAIGGDSRFALSLADIGHGGPSFTVDLLERLRAELGEPLAFIAGMDVLHELHRWREPSRVLDQAPMIVISRPGQETLTPADVGARIPGASSRITVVVTPGVAITATELRARVSQGRSIRYLVPDTVAEYIRAHDLYRLA